MVSFTHAMIVLLSMPYAPGGAALAENAATADIIQVHLAACTAPIQYPSLDPSTLSSLFAPTSLPLTLLNKPKPSLRVKGEEQTAAEDQKIKKPNGISCNEDSDCQSNCCSWGTGWKWWYYVCQHASESEHC